MTLTSLLILLLVAGVCGAIGQAIAGYSRGGCLASIALGFIGAVLGMWIAQALGLHEIFALRIGGQTFPVIWSIIGAALFVAIISMFARRRVI
ncbi:MAG TPA: GlsB/YeaQ/YmgE family stress response membrane protein [Blastocatellia bacterium]|nr:GlsB/YeaQ/YmgE family stress response membrane protein [Blastocatellia bacterium]